MPSFAISPSRLRISNFSYASALHGARKEKSTLIRRKPRSEIGAMFPKDWTQPCGNCCTKKYAGVFLIPWRIFCKKGCSADGDTWAECVEACNELCYKDPVLKDRQWTSFIDRSPGDDNYSLECFHACVAGCGFKFGISPEKVDQVQPNRPIPLPPPPPPPSPMPDKSTSTLDAEPTCDDLPGTSA